MLTISGIIWGDRDRVARREGGLTVGQVVFPPVMNAQARAEVKRIKERSSKAVAPVQPVDTYTPTPEQDQRAKDMLARAKARSRYNSHGLGE